MGFDAGDSNLYRYISNNPLTSSDPSGLQPWITGGSPDPYSVKQTGIPNCALAAALAGLAKQRPDDIVKMLKKQNNDEYYVQLPTGGVVKVTNAQIPSIAVQSNGVWGSAIETAINTLHKDPTISEARAISLVTGNPKLTGYEWGTGLGNKASYVNDYNSMMLYNFIQKKGVAVASTPERVKYPGLIASHVYTVMDFKNGWVQLRNPWGRDGVPLDSKGFPLFPGSDISKGIFWAPSSFMINSFATWVERN